MRTLLLLERQLSPLLDNISSYIGFAEHIYPSFGPGDFGLEISFSIIFNEENISDELPHYLLPTQTQWSAIHPLRPASVTPIDNLRSKLIKRVTF